MVGREHPGMPFNNGSFALTLIALTAYLLPATGQMAE